MIRPIIIAALASAMAMPAYSQFNSPQAQGYATRAAAMLAEGNYQGCVDQSIRAMELNPAALTEPMMWLSAVASFRAGYPEAEERVNAYLQRCPASAHRAEALLMQASLVFYRADYARALAMLEAVPSECLNDNDGEDLDYRLAYCCMKLGDYQAASELMDRLASTARYGTLARFYQGYIAYATGRTDRAMELLQPLAQGSGQSHTDVMARYYVAQMEFRRSHYQAALAMARQVMDRTDVEPEFTAEATRIAGESLFALGSEQEGLKLLRPYVEQAGDAAPNSSRYIVGVDHYRSGRADRALELLQSVSAEPNAMGQSAALYLGLCYLDCGDNAQALMAFQKSLAMDLDPEVTEHAYYNYAVTRMEGGRIPFGNTADTLEEFLRRYPSGRYADSVRQYLVKGYMSADDYDSALRAVKALKRPDAEMLAAEQRIHFVLGTRHYSAGDYAKALEQLQQADRLASHSDDIARQTTLWLGDTYYAMGRYADAEKHYRRYINRARRGDANLPSATYSLGYALFGEHKYADARHHLTEAARATSLPEATRADAWNRVADTHYYQHQFADALQAYQTAYDTNPATGDYALLQQAIMQGHLGRPLDKVATLTTLTERFPASALIPAALTEKALTLATTGHRDRAIEVYTALAASHPSTAQGRNALLQVAILQANSGNASAAEQAYRRVITLYPTSSEAAMAVQDLTRIHAEAGTIDELHTFLASTQGAPQLDAAQYASLASDALLARARRALEAQRADSALAAATQLLQRYPDSSAAEEALAIKADTELTLGKTGPALADYTALAERASTPAMTHRARMGILTSARDMGQTDLILSTAEAILGSAAGSDADLPRVRYIQACAYADSDRPEQARAIWQEMAATPADLYGTRSAYSLAESLHLEGRNDDAATAINALIDANPPHPYWLGRSFILLSDILRAQGSTFEADEYLRVLRTNYPGSEPDIFQMIDSRLSQQ